MDNRSTCGQPAPIASQDVPYTTSVGKSTAIASPIDNVRLMATTDCWIEINKDSTKVPAANTALYLPAFSPEYFVCPNGSYVMALQVSAAGTLYITPIM